MASVNLNTAERLDITCRRGDTFVLDVNVKDSDGVALDATLYGYKMEVRQDEAGDVVIASTDITVTGVSSGKVTPITITASNMLRTAGVYVYGLQATKNFELSDRNLAFRNF